MMGTAAAICADAGMHESRPVGELGGHATARYKLVPPHPTDVLPAGLCVRCGIVAQHGTASDCIDALRDKLADVTGSDVSGLKRR